MLDEVIGALDVMVDRMTRAIDFSHGFANCNETSMAIEEAFDFHDKAIADHEAWYTDYSDAIDKLEKLGFRRRWTWDIRNLKIPQVAFSEVPIITTLGVDIANHIWVLGAGECYWGDEQQPTGDEKLDAGDVRMYRRGEDQGGAEEIKEISNLFDVSLVEYWELKRNEFAALAQQMRDMRFAIAVSGGLPGNAIAPRVGRPRDDTVAKRRKDVQECIDNGLDGPQIVNALRITYPGFKKSTLEDDKRALKGKK